MNNTLLNIQRVEDSEILSLKRFVTVSTIIMGKKYLKSIFHKYWNFTYLYYTVIVMDSILMPTLSIYCFAQIPMHDTPCMMLNKKPKRSPEWLRRPNHSGDFFFTRKKLPEIFLVAPAPSPPLSFWDLYFLPHLNQ